MCNHGPEFWIGRADGIFCKACGAKVDLNVKPEPKPAEVKAPEPEPEPEKPKKAAPKKGGKK